MRMSPTVQLHLSVLLFGTAALIGKLVDLPAMQLVLGRTLFGALALAAFMALLKHTSQTRWWPSQTVTSTPKLVGYLLCSSLVLVGHWWSFFYAIQVSGVGVALVGFSAFPVFVTLLEALLQGRKVDAKDGFTTLLVVLGLWLVAPAISWHNSAFQGLVWGVLSGALFAVLALQNKSLVHVFGGIKLGFWQQVLAALMCLLLVDLPALISGLGSTSPVPTAKDLVYLLVLGIGLTALPHVMFIACLKQVRAHTAAIVASLEPVYAIAFAWLLLAEQPAITTLAGALIILLAVVLNQ
ncbi:MAG TPA: EamA family transporter [Oceanospirillaceae bacterium]|nr:EamA family transporter [Oceanospirillaceae bacterium]